MKNALTVMYEEKMKSQIMLKMVSGKTPALKELVKEYIESNQQHASYIISAYFHVKNEIVG